MTDAPAQQQRIVRWRRRAVVFLLVVAAVLVVRAIADMWLGGAMNAEIARLEERHGPLQWDSVRKVHPWKTWPRRMSPNNRARLMDAAAARITVASDAEESVLYAANGQADETITSEEARAIAEANREAVELAIRAARVPHSNWGGVSGFVPPSMTDVRFLSTILAITARGDMDAGRADAAATDLTAGFAIATAMASEPANVMFLIATRMAGVQHVLLKDLLNRTKPTAPALAELARVIDEGLAAPPARTALLGSLKVSRAKWPRVERGWFFTSEDGYPARPSRWTRSIAWLARPVIRYRALRDLADKGRAVDAASMTRAERAGIVSSLRPPAPGLTEVGDAWSLILGHAATAVALRRFQIEHGAYPVRLDELVPGYLKAVPIDPYTGGPTEYVRSGNGFELRTPAARQTKQLELYQNWNVTR
jgi:hypothetical protein